jgi:hypothetical protein
VRGPYPAIAAGDLAKYLKRAVLGTVVDQNELEIVEALR